MLNKQNISSIVLVLSNISVVFGVLHMDYDISSIIVIYWAENVIIGILNFFKILMAQKPILNAKFVTANGGQAFPFGRKIISSFMAFFFLFHYGIFVAMHGVFVFAMLAGDGLDYASIMYGVFIMFLSHLASFFLNFIGKQEYKEISASEAMNAPYKRVVVLHITIIFGGFLIVLTQGTAPVLILFIILKTFFDLKLHNREHKLGGNLTLKINN